MNRQRIEYKALAVYEQIKLGHKVEDSQIELKADWPDPEKAARRIAGHANAARGEEIIWIIGLDEERGVQSVRPTEFANWWPQVESHFDGMSPFLSSHFVVNTDDGPIYVLHFETRTAPYVVKNPQYGRPNGGPVEREVPWRVGTRVRSAKREDLIRLLVPIQSLPSIEVLKVDAWVEEMGPRKSPDESISEIERSLHLMWTIRFDLYVVPRNNERVVFPVHRARIRFEIDDKRAFDTADLFFRTDRSILHAYYDSPTVIVTQSEALVSGPGKLLVDATYYGPHDDLSSVGNAMATLTITPAGSDRSILVKQRLLLRSNESSYLCSWVSD